MAATGPPGPGWYADPLGLAGVRWWDGATWVGPASIPQPPGRRLPGWAKTCFAIGIAVGVVNLAFVTLALFFVGVGTLLAGSPPHEVHRTLTLWDFAALGLAIAIFAAAIRGGGRLRLSALMVAIAMMAGSWAWFQANLPPRPHPTLAELKRSPAAQLIYPGAVVATQLTQERESYWAGSDPAPARIVRDEATNDSWPQVLAWFKQQLTADGWTQTDAASTLNTGTFALAWSWAQGNETFTLSVYSEAGRDTLYQQAPELRGRTIAIDTDLQ